MRLVEEREERAERALLEDVVPALGRVSGDVAEGPDCLLAHVEN